MAYEVKPWKKPGCDLSLKVGDFSDRETFSREINEEYHEGGGLNANYRTVDAIANVVSILALTLDLQHGIHFVFKTGGGESVLFDFCDEEVRNLAMSILSAHAFFGRDGGVVTIGGID